MVVGIAYTECSVRNFSFSRSLSSSSPNFGGLDISSSLLLIFLLTHSVHWLRKSNLSCQSSIDSPPRPTQSSPGQSSISSIYPAITSLFITSSNWTLRESQDCSPSSAVSGSACATFEACSTCISPVVCSLSPT